MDPNLKFIGNPAFHQISLQSLSKTENFVALLFPFLQNRPKNYDSTVSKQISHAFPSTRLHQTFKSQKNNLKHKKFITLIQFGNFMKLTFWLGKKWKKNDLFAKFILNLMRSISRYCDRSLCCVFRLRHFMMTQIFQLKRAMSTEFLVFWIFYQLQLILINELTFDGMSIVGDLYFLNQDELKAQLIAKFTKFCIKLFKLSKYHITNSHALFTKPKNGATWYFAFLSNRHEKFYSHNCHSKLTYFMQKHIKLQNCTRVLQNKISKSRVTLKRNRSQIVSTEHCPKNYPKNLRLACNWPQSQKFGTFTDHFPDGKVYLLV